MSVPQRIRGEDGREYVSVNLAKHRVFATACVDALARTEGRRLHFLLRTAKAVIVPVEVLPLAREALRRAGKSNAIPEEVDE